ncbi:hypothetical protein BDV36DRAFT_310537 [Aspergillus pseudocaelatus]|uniref:Heterokaryon incompatibility domain-containing protein n=1 Tax=Aspergillus pseudocaelatus TaxID=1825620 RepID=A0ABQ6WFT7_9EURO|nr:hypothetical protein BDV36DRAFT_310537 [Aspergillus pseudocaelatus]
MPERFEYDPLPEPTCIRLVSFVPQDDATCLPLAKGEPLLQLSLCTVDLRDAPHYEALSYTWGSPFSPEDPRSRAYEDEKNHQRVIINGREHEIGRNLWEFLHQQQQANAYLGKVAAEMLASGLDTHGRTPLMRAVIDNIIDLTEALLALGAETGAQDKQGKTALHYALLRDNPNLELAELLVYHGADIHAQTLEGKTPLDNAEAEMVALITSFNKDLGGRALPRGLRLSAERPMWVDSISINQKDITERNKQVTMMSDIYSTAMSVVVWLGVEDDRRISLALDSICDPRPWILLTSLRDSGFAGPRLENAMKVGYSSKQILDAQGIGKLMARSWWSRTWVIQELALAKRALIICGSVTTYPMQTFLILCALCGIPSPWTVGQDISPVLDTTALFESARFSGLPGIEALMLADISFRAAAHTGEREYYVKKILKAMKAVPNVSWGRRLSLQNLGRLSWWSQSSNPRDKVFALLGIACPDPRHQQIIVDYDIPTDEVFVQYGRLFMQGSSEPIQNLHTGESYVFEPLEGLSYVQDTPKPHPEFQDYKAKLPSWTPNFSAHLTTCRIWSREFGAASAIANSPAILSHPDPRILCVSGHIVDCIIAIEPTQSKGDVHEPEVMAWLELILPLLSKYLGGGNPVDALRKTLTVGKESQNKKRARSAFREYMTGKLRQSPMEPQLESILTRLRKSGARDALPSAMELRKQKQELQNQNQEFQRSVLKIVEGVQRQVQELQDKKKGPEELDQGFLKLTQELQDQGYNIRLRRQAQTETGWVDLEPMQENLEPMQENLEPMQEDLQVRDPKYSHLEFYFIFKRYYRSRCLFRTRKGYIGLGPVGVQPGDEIWLFATARTPFILRRPSEGSLKRETLGSNSSTAESECRTFIGETYVHGIMNGEAMRKGDFRPVSLV